MPVKIVTDSTCDLPDEQVSQGGITVIPLYINLGDRGYLDGVELSRAEFYRNLPSYNPPPTTAAKGPEMFRQAYQRLAQEGADEILSIHISQKLSATLDVARQAALETPGIPVTVLDSQQLSMGTGFLVQAAARLAAQGARVKDLLPLLLDQVRRTYTFAALDTLEFLRRSGRMNPFIANLGNLLQLKPLLLMDGGSPYARRVRTRKKAEQALVRLLEQHAPLERAAVVHADARQRAEALFQRVGHLLPPGETPLVEITPVIGAHIGPGVVGFVCVRAE